MTSKTIKALVEDHLGIKDLSSRNRENFIVYARQVYYRLCRKHTSESFFDIGNNLGRDHATALHGEKQFYIHCHKDYYRAHRSAHDEISASLALVENKPNSKKPKSLEELEQEYRIKTIKIIEVHHGLLRKEKQNTKILRDYPEIKKVLELDHSDIEEFSRIANVFLKRKQREKQLL